MADRVDRNVLDKLFNLNPDEAVRQYGTLTLQVTKFRKMTDGNTDKPKVRVHVSDGDHTAFAVLPSDANVNDVYLPQNSIITITSYKPFLMNGTKPIIMIYGFEMLAETAEKIGNPVSLSKAKQGAAATTTNSTGSTGSTGSAAPAAAPASNPAPAAPAPRSAPAPAKPLSSAARKKLTSNLIPISSISPYTNAWTIRARVGVKSPMRTYRNARGEGKLFNVTFVDESGEIRATGFNETADLFYDKLRDGHVYYISKCSVNMAKKQFSNVQNDYELMFDRNSVIEESHEQVDVPQVRYNVVPIKDLEKVPDPKTASVDVVGVIREIGECQNLTTRAGKNLDKRDLMIVDQSGVIVRTTLWANSAKDFSVPLGSVIALKGARVNEFNGQRTLSVAGSTAMAIDPDIPEAHLVKGWFDKEGQNMNFQEVKGEGPQRSRDPPITIESAKGNNLGMSDAPDYFSVVARISYIRQKSMMYPSCGQNGCMKKVIQETNGQWRCEKDDITIDEPTYRYLVTMSIADITDQIWVTCFNDVAESIMGIPANKMHEMTVDDENGNSDILHEASFKEYTFRVRARADNYNEQEGVRYQVMFANPVNYKAEAERELDLIEKYY